MDSEFFRSLFFLSHFGAIWSGNAVDIRCLYEYHIIIDVAVVRSIPCYTLFVSLPLRLFRVDPVHIWMPWSLIKSQATHHQ